MPLEDSSEGLMQKSDGFGAPDWINRRQLFGQVDGFVAQAAVIFDHKRGHVAVWVFRPFVSCSNGGGGSIPARRPMIEGLSRQGTDDR